MHLYIITRGIKHAVDKFISELSGKYMPFKWQGQTTMLQVGVRPVQLWEIAFPDDQKDVMFETLWYSGIKNNGFAEHQKKYQKFIWPLRKLLGINEMPQEWDHTKGTMPVDGSGVQKIAIGVKPDAIFDDNQLKAIKKQAEELKKKSKELNDQAEELLKNEGEQI